MIKVGEQGDMTYEAFESQDLRDYKFFCFDGEVKCCQVIGGRSSKMYVDFFDREWCHQPYQEPAQYPHYEGKIAKPRRYEQMWEMAERLSKGIPFVRIDLYDVDGKIYFGEITFFPTSGHGSFSPDEWNYTFGNYIKI